MRIFYGWFIVLGAFLNLFLLVAILFYGLPVFYPAIMDGLRCTRAQLATGFLLGFLLGALPVGLLAGVLIDKFGARRVIYAGVCLAGASMILMGSMTRLWQFYALCIAEMSGYALAGPIPNQVVIANWFNSKRGQAMGYAYLGLGLGGVLSPLAAGRLIESMGWQHALHLIGAVILAVLIPVAHWVTKSHPRELSLVADGLPVTATLPSETGQLSDVPLSPSTTERARMHQALRSRNFWLILAGSTLTIGAIGAVTQHLVLFLRDQGYLLVRASQISSAVLAASLIGRVVVGHLADRRSKKNVMAFFYLLVAISIPMLLLSGQRFALLAFVLLFGFGLGADYMLVPLLTAECFGLPSLGKILSLIISGYSLGQWLAPWITGKLFDLRHSYTLAWALMAAASLLGAILILLVTTPSPPGTFERKALR